MVIRTADEAQELAQQYLRGKYAPEGDIFVTAVAFDKDLFTVLGH